MSTVDNLAAARVIYLLVQPFDKSPAFKLGIIDENGKKIKEPETSAEKNSYSYLHRIIFKLKRMIGALPGGKTQLASLATAYMLIRDGVDLDKESNKVLIEEYYRIEPPEEILKLVEEAIAATTTGNVAMIPGKGRNMVLKRGMPMQSLPLPPTANTSITFKDFVKLRNK